MGKALHSVLKVPGSIPKWSAIFTDSHLLKFWFVLTLIILLCLLQIHELKTPGESAAVTALSLSKDYYIVACKYQYMKLSEIHNLELFDIQHGGYLRAIRGKKITVHRLR